MPEELMSWDSVFEELFLMKNPVDDEFGCQILTLDEKDSRIYICQLWEGVFLWGNEIHIGYIQHLKNDLNKMNYSVLNICHSGRCEVSLSDDTYVYMAPGLFNVNCTSPKEGYSYPGGFYEGIEIALNLDVLKEQVPPELSSFGLDLDYLLSLLKKGSGNYMATVTDDALQESRFLYDSLKKGNLKLCDYRFLSVSLLYHLKKGYASETKNRTLVTRGQRRIAIEVEQILMKDFRKHFTVEELAERYEISPSALKKYFELVFGMPISYYLREKRMEKAKKLLIESRMNVGEISTICGYENQGKFGAAFKAYSGASPLEYRRLHKNENKE